MTDETTPPDIPIPTAVQFRLACLCSSIRDKLAEAEANKHGITICNEQDPDHPIIIVYDELPDFRTFLEHHQCTPQGS